MGTKLDVAARLTNTIDALELLILESDDKEILELANVGNNVRNSSSEKKTSSVDRSMINERIASLAGIPKEFAARVHYVKALIANRHDVPPQMVSVFSSNRRPSDDELDEIVQELVNRGIIKK